MPAAAWLELRSKHIPDCYEHLVRYVGWYSNRARGERAKKVLTQAGAALSVPGEEPASEAAARAKACWARLPTERSPPVDPASWPPYASLPLTYHLVSDIA